MTLPAMVSGMAMSLSSVSVVVSSLLLQRYRKPHLNSFGEISRKEPLLRRMSMDEESQAPTPVLSRLARLVGGRKYVPLEDFGHNRL